MFSITPDSDRGQNLKEIIHCHVDINMVEDNERISKWTHLFKLSQPFEIQEFKVEIFDEKFGQNSAIFSTNIAIIEEI